MKIARVEFTGVSPYSQSAPMQSVKSRDETHAEYEERCWIERCHIDGDGIVFIPPMSFKNCLSEAAKYKSIKIPGKGNSTYTKHFEAGVMCVTPVSLGVKKEDIKSERLFVPSDGRRGGTKRVWKRFSIFHEWGGTIEFIVLDELVDEEVFRQHIVDAGRFIGIGRFRPRNNGYYGRFEVGDIVWE